MFTTIIKSTIRNLVRNKTFTFLNLLGLALAFTSVIIIYLWIKDELSFDTFHNDVDDIYLVYKEYNVGAGTDKNLSTPVPLSFALVAEIPEVKFATHFARSSCVFRKGEKFINENNFCCTDTSFFKIFTYRFIEGDPNTCLNKIENVVLTREMADKYFGDSSPINKEVEIDGKSYIVSAIVEPLSKNSVADFDFFGRIEVLLNPGDDSDWFNHWLSTYVKLSSGSDLGYIYKKFDQFTFDKMEGRKTVFRLQNIVSQHLYNLDGSQAKLQGIIIFAIIGIFIMVIAIINFMNLSTARYTKRSLEVGLKKVLGSSRKLLVKQFLFESLLITFISLIISIILVEIFIGKVNIITEKELALHQSKNFFLYAALILVALVTGVIAGAYPAFVLSSVKPVHSLKGVFAKGKLGSNFRRFLVILQFTISVALIISSITIYQQLSYLNNKELGMDKENVCALRLPGGQAEKIDVFKAELQKSTLIESVSAALSVPFDNMAIMRGLKWDDMTDDDAVAMAFQAVTDDYFETMKINILQGRALSSDYTDDTANVMFNESAIKLMGWNDPIGRIFEIDGAKGKIVGVVQDYHHLPLNMAIEPMIIIYSKSWSRRCFIRYQENRSKEAIEYIESIWNENYPTVPFEHVILDEYYKRLYTESQKIGMLISVFTILAIIISCLGLFGLASHSVEQRRREIGIRKALGASFIKLINLLSTDFTKWVILANILAMPIAWYFMNKWLQNFAYHTSIKWYVFATGFFLSISVALITTFFHTWKTANTNPAEVLKYE